MRFFLSRYGPIVALLLLPSLALAEDGQAMNDLLKVFNEQTKQWLSPIEAISKYLLFSLATISLVWTAATMMLKGADLPEILFELVRFIMFIGFFYALIDNSSFWAGGIVKGFTDTAQAVTVVNNALGGENIGNPLPSQILERGFTLSDRINEANEGWIIDNLAYWLVSLIVVVIYAVVAAMVVLIYIEMYIVLTAGVIVLGFAGTPWTSDYAKKYLIYTVSVGLKLMMTMIVVGLCEGFISTWVASTDRELGENGSLMAIIALLILFVYLVMKVPDFVQNLTTGAVLSGNSSGVLGAAKAAITTAAVAGGTVAGGVAGGGASLANASRLSAAKGTSGGAMATAKNLGSAAMKTAGQRMQGKGAYGQSKRHSTTMGQVNDNLKSSLSKAKASIETNDAATGNISGGSSYRSPAGDQE